jgi:hypothetical protein
VIVCTRAFWGLAFQRISFCRSTCARSCSSCWRNCGVSSAPKSFGFEDLADLEIRFARHRIRAALGPIDGFLQRRTLPDPVAGDQLLVSAKGPSITLRDAPEKCTRAPTALAQTFSPSSFKDTAVTDSAPTEILPSRPVHLA